MFDELNIYTRSVVMFLFFVVSFFTGYLVRWFFAGKKLKEAEYSLVKIVREQIQEIYRLSLCLISFSIERFLSTSLSSPFFFFLASPTTSTPSLYPTANTNIPKPVTTTQYGPKPNANASELRQTAMSDYFPRR